MKTYKVSLSVSKKIKTAKDLGDFYAFMERNEDFDSVLELSYDFPKSEQERIEKLIDSINYQRGVYDIKNVARIVKSALKYEMNKREARRKAIELQLANFDKAMSWEEVNQNSDYLYRLGKRYGLIREFKENGLL